MISSSTPTYIPIGDAVGLHTIQTSAHKTSRLSIYTIRPAHRDTSPMATLLFGVLRRGSEKYPKLSLLNRRLDELYGTTLTLRNFLIGDKHILSFTAEMLSEQYLPCGETCDLLTGVMEVLSEMLCNPLTDSEGCLRAPVVEQEKISLCDSIKADINDPRTYASMRHRLIMCKDEPYGVSLSGQVDHIMAMTPEEVTKAYHAFMRESAWEVYYTGQASAQRVEQCFRQAFGDSLSLPKANPLCQTSPHLPPQAPQYVEESLAIEQGRLCISWSNTSPEPSDHAPMVVLCEMLGVMQSAILFRTVREQLGLCYDCDASLEWGKGILTVMSGIHPKNRQAAEEAILDALEQIKAGNIDPLDVHLAQLSLQNVYAQISESPASTEAYWFRHQTEGLCVSPEEMLSRFMAVTPEDVVTVANKLRLDTVYFLNATGQEVEV